MPLREVLLDNRENMAAASRAAPLGVYSVFACVALTMAATARGEQRRVEGWQVFGAEAGVLIGATMVMGYGLGTSYILRDPYHLTGGQRLTDEAATWALFLGTAGFVGVGAVAFGNAARMYGWDPVGGWGAAGVLPGAVEGVALACALLWTLFPRAATDVSLAVGGAGAVVGGLAGYVVYRALAASRGSALATTALFWLGFVGLGSVVASQVHGATNATALALASAAAGGLALSALAIAFRWP